MIKLAYTLTEGFDLVNQNGIQTEDGLLTAVELSLFLDARATRDELVSAGLPLDYFGGCWMDSYPEIEGHVLGSKLWLLSRAKREPGTLAKAELHAAQALKWLVTDKVASKVTATASWWGNTSLLIIAIEIQRPGEVQPRWRRVWNAISGEPLAEAA